MKLFFMCNTYMQLIASMQIKKELYPNENADLILSDHSVNAMEVVERLRQVKLFDRVGCAETKKDIYGKRNVFTNIKDSIGLASGKIKKFTKYLWKDDNRYDRIFYFNFEPIIYLAYTESCDKGLKPVCSRIEEGINSYDFMISFEIGTKFKLASKIRKIFNKSNAFDETRDFYCFYPELFPKGYGTCHKIPHISRKEKGFIETINEVFNYNPKNSIFEQKYIFFASSSDVDGHDMGETGIILRIAELVGKENLLVKMHPRDNRHVYEKYGIAVLKESSVPWEVIQLNHDFSDFVFASLSSGGVLNASAMLKDNISTYYLYKLIKKPKTEVELFCEENLENTVMSLQKMGELKKVIIAQNLNEICISND